MTVFQTRHWQEQIIAGATKAGDLHTLYYLIEIQLPKYLEKKLGKRRMLAQHPPGFLPVVHLTPDPDAAYITIQLLKEWLAHANRDWLTDKRSALEFRILLVPEEVLRDSDNWYEWWPDSAGGPELPAIEVDRFCAGCGSVQKVLRSSGWICDCCGVKHDEDGLPGPDRGVGNGEDTQTREGSGGAYVRDMRDVRSVLVPGWHEGRESCRGYYLPLPSASGAGESLGEHTGCTAAVQQPTPAYAGA